MMRVNKRLILVAGLEWELQFSDVTVIVRCGIVQCELGWAVGLPHS